MDDNLARNLPDPDGDDRSPQSARDRANSRWGMSPSEQFESTKSPYGGDSSEPGSALSRASGLWGSAAIHSGGKDADAGSKALDGDQLKNAEANAPGLGPKAGSPAEAGLGKESDAFYSGKKLGEATRDNPGMGRFKRAMSVVNSRKGRGAGVVGIVMTIVFMFFAIGAGSLDTEHYKSNFLKKTNSVANRVIKKRRSSNLVRAISKFDSSLSESLGKSAIEAAVKDLEQQGFKFVKDAEGKFTSIEFKSGETSGVIDMTAKDMSAELDRFYKSGGTQFADDFLEKMSPNNRLLGEITRGPAAEGFFSKFKISRVGDFLERAKTKPNATAAEQLADDVLHADDALREAEKPTGSAGQVVDPGQGTDPKTGKPIPTEQSILNEAQSGLNQSVDDLTKGNAAGIVDALPDGLSDGAKAAEEAFAKPSIGAFTELAAKISPKIAVEAAAKTAEVVAKPTIVAQQACKVKGAITRVNNVRRYTYAIELMRFAFGKFGTFADRRKAGYSSGKANALMELWMHRPNAKTGAVFGTAGATANAFGNKDVHANSLLRSKYSVGYASAGILAAISRFAENFTGSCKVVHNTFLNIGLGVVSLGAAIISGSATAIVEAATAALPLLGLIIAQEIVTMVVTPILVRTGVHLVLSGVESGDVLEAAVTSGFVGGMFSMNGKHGLAPVTKSLRTALKYDADQAKKREVARSSFYERYLDRNNDDSLLARTANGVAVAMLNLRSSGVVNFASTIASSAQKRVARGMFPASYAASDVGSLCTDPQALDNDIATDDWCNVNTEFSPKLDPQESYRLLLSGGYIKPDGSLNGDYALGFSKQCTEGSPALMYKNDVPNDGTDDGKTNLCIEPGQVLAGETKTLADAYDISDLSKPQYAWWQKAIGNTAYAAPAETTSNQPVGVNIRLLNWIGYMDDMADSKQTLTKNFSNVQSGGQSTTATTQPGTASSCPSSPTIKQEGINAQGQAYAEGKPVNVMICNVHGVHVSAEFAADLDNLINAMSSNGYSVAGSAGFRSNDLQIKLKAGGTGTTPGYSNHQSGNAVDVSCSGNGKSYSAGNGRGLAGFMSNVSSYPCLNWIHQNSSRFNLTLQCDGKSAKGEEIAKSTGGCEWWHLSRTGG